MSDNNDNNVISESVLSFHSQILFYHTKDGNPIGGSKTKDLVFFEIKTLDTIKEKPLFCCETKNVVYLYEKGMCGKI